MGQDEYISIAEFARRAGITPQAVYKQLNNQVDNQLSTYTKIHNGKKRIHIKALELFLPTGVNQVVNQFNNQVDNFSQPVDNQVDNQINQVVDFLKDQIKRKDIQIEQLQQDLRTSREDLTRLATELAKIADQGQHLQMKNLWVVSRLLLPRIFIGAFGVSMFALLLSEQDCSEAPIRATTQMIIESRFIKNDFLFNRLVNE